jgi:hypothetical protein
MSKLYTAATFIITSPHRPNLSIQLGQENYCVCHQLIGCYVPKVVRNCSTINDRYGAIAADY